MGLQLKIVGSTLLKQFFWFQLFVKGIISINRPTLQFFNHFWKVGLSKHQEVSPAEDPLKNRRQTKKRKS